MRFLAHSLCQWLLPGLKDDGLPHSLSETNLRTTETSMGHASGARSDDDRTIVERKRVGCPNEDRSQVSLGRGDQQSHLGV